MAVRIRQAQTNFTAGELSPLMAARSDLRPYRNGAAALLNRAPISQGGTRTRPGLRHVAHLPSASVRLEPMVFSSDQRYVLAFTPGRFDAWTAEGVYCGAIGGAPWTAAMLPQMRVLVAGDTILLFHQDMPPQRIRRTGALTFAHDAMPIEVPPFARYAASSVTMAVSAVGAPGSGATATTSAAFFTAGYVGRQLRYRGKRATITGVTDAQNATISWVDDSTGTATTATPSEWFEEAWGLSFGWPGAAAFFDNRLVLAGWTAQPNGIVASKVGAFFNFDIGAALDDEAIATAATGDDGVPRIRHVVAAERLLFLADQGVWFSPNSGSDPITPKSFRVRQVSAAGSGRTAPAIFDGAVLFADQTGRTVRAAVWVDTAQSYSTDAVSLWAEHLIRQPVQVSAYAGAFGSPEALALLVNPDGELAVFHSIAAEQVAAWMPWRTTGAFLSVAAAGADVFAATRRTIAGAERIALERFDVDAEPLDAAAVATLASPGRTFSGFSHLAGQAVQIVSRGHYMGEATVAGDGTLTLPALAPDVDLVEAGLAFEQRIRPMPADADLGDGAARGLVKRLIRVIVQVDRAGTFRIRGRDVLLDFRGTDAATPAPTRTGLIKFGIRGVIDEEAQFDLIVPLPQKVTVLGLTREVSING